MNEGIGCVLDTSALLSFGNNPAVGELMVMLNEDGGRLAVPVLCAVEAINRDRTFMPVFKVMMVSVVTGFAPVVANNLDDIQELSRLAAGLPLSCASAALLAAQLDIPLLTADPAVYGGVRNGPGLIVIEDEQ